MKNGLVRALLVALVITAGAVGCADTDDTGGRARDRVAATGRQAPAAGSAVKRPAPRRVPLTRRQAAIRYLAIVKPYNIALESLEKSVNGGAPIGTLRAAAAKVAAANRIEIRRLAQPLWPVGVRALMRQLRGESVKAQPYWLRAARAQTRDALVRDVMQAGQHDGVEAASRIRRLLDLAKYDENDYS